MTVASSSRALTGRLILPTPAQRTPDGQVLIQWAGCDRPEPLVWENASELQADCDVLASLPDRGQDVLPERLRGWKQVKPLESLAGARTADTTWVSLPEPRWDGRRWVIHGAPTEVSGPDQARALLLGAEGSKLQVRFFDATRQTYGPGVAVETAVRPERTDLSRLAGQEVWLYGQDLPGQNGQVTSLQPLEARRFQPDQTHQGLEKCRRALRNLWKPTAQTMNETHRTLLQPQPGEVRFEPGKPLLVMHLFGGFQGPGGDPARPLGIVGGHFAYGTAQVTDDRELDLTYHQVYGQNPDQILSGKVSWEAYMGNLERGWMYTRPVTDMVIDHPALQRTYDFGGGLTFSFFEALEQELTRMEARYRVGDGDGVALITPRTNCSQDSASAMWAVTERIRQLDQTIAVSPQEPQSADFRALVAIARDLQAVLAPQGAPAAWRANAQGRASEPRNLWESGLQLLRTRNTVLPREHQEAVAEVLLEHGAQILVQQTNTLGAAAGVLEPQVPTRLPL